MGGSRLHVCGVLLHQGDIGAVSGDIGAVCAEGDENDIMKIFDIVCQPGGCLPALNHHHHHHHPTTPDNTRQHQRKPPRMFHVERSQRKAPRKDTASSHQRKAPRCQQKAPRTLPPAAPSRKRPDARKPRTLPPAAPKRYHQQPPADTAPMPAESAPNVPRGTLPATTSHHQPPPKDTPIPPAGRHPPGWQTHTHTHTRHRSKGGGHRLDGGHRLEGGHRLDGGHDPDTSFMPADTARLCRHRPTSRSAYAPLNAPLTLRCASAALSRRFARLRYPPKSLSNPHGVLSGHPSRPP